MNQMKALTIRIFLSLQGKGSNFFHLFFILVFFSLDGVSSTQGLFYVGSQNSDLVRLLRENGIAVTPIKSLHPGEVKRLPDHAALLVLADGYPSSRTAVSEEFYKIIRNKSIRLYLEFPETLPGRGKTPDDLFHATLERGVVTTPFFGDVLPPMSILGVNDCQLISVAHPAPLIVLAKVAGFAKAEYGLENTEVHPLLFKDENIMVCTSSLSNFSKGRFAPVQSWQAVWQSILGWLLQVEAFHLDHWFFDPQPSFGEHAPLNDDTRLQSVQRGSEWFFKSRLLLHPAWKEEWLSFQGDGKAPFGPPIRQEIPVGDGSLGILEGHASVINRDGRQQYRYWIRTDVQGEAAYALAAAGDLLQDSLYMRTAEKLVDFMFTDSRARSLTSDREKGSYGLLGWSYTHPYVIYADDNARAVLGAIGASSLLGERRWDKLIVENILANFRTTSRQGFQGQWLREEQISEKGWEHYFHRDLVRTHPHFESWMWACYLWLYDKTGYQPLLEKAKTAIRLTMQSYPDKWRWTNGIQQERARMILPLAWLLRVEDTDEHRAWLMRVVDDLLEYQQPNGALMEALGDAAFGSYGRSGSNAEYGATEAPLIFNNGDEVADMLYTNNFAFFALNEAAKSSGMDRYQSASVNLSEFLIRIQARSDLHPDLEGAWFRAFDYSHWDYWASNADAGWGAWCTLSGWIQSWIVATQAMIAQDTCFWDQTANNPLQEVFDECRWMLEEE